MKDKKGFTLIELLAVIIILGVLMIIAIPSVTKYISDSRKSAYIDTAKQVANAAKNLVNAGKLEMYDTSTAYYIPNSCIKVENGNKAKSPYGEFIDDKTYVVVTYDGKGYDYYWVSLDETGTGVKEPISIGKLEEKNIETDLTKDDVVIKENIGNSQKSYILNIDDCKSFTEVSANIDSFYNMIINDALDDDLLREYTGEHQDSINKNGTEKIYYYYASNDSNANRIKNKWNIIFGGFCWQMIRTTDTGGMKLLYNGVPVDGKCSDDRANTSADYAYISKSQFNEYGSSDSIEKVGYMSNKKYNLGSKTFSTSVNTVLVKNSAECLYFSDEIELVNVNGSMEYKLKNPRYESAYGNSSLVGLYSLCNRNDGVNGTKSAKTAYYVHKVAYSNVYVNILKEGSTTEHIEGTFYIGANIDGPDGNGFYTIINPSIVDENGWMAAFSSGTYFKKKYICIDSNPCKKPYYIISQTNNSFSGIDLVNQTYLYGDGATKNSDGKYILSNPSPLSIPNSNLHYTCFSKQNICDKLYYIFYNENYASYVDITGKTNIDDALKEMLFDSDVNKNNSKIKNVVDSWYENNLIQYEDYLEDVVFCNDRSYKISGSWVSSNNINNGASFSFNKKFVCSNDTDKFSVSNPAAKLKHPIGLPTYNEINMLGNNNLTGKNQLYYTITPSNLYYYSGSPQMYTNASYRSVHDSIGVRPMISLKKGVGYLKGDGSMNNPYIVN